MFEKESCFDIDSDYEPIYSPQKELYPSAEE